MQKDLLAELHLPKLDLKGPQNIVTHNSTRLTCLIRENNEYKEKSNTITPNFKVILGATVPDYPSSPTKNVKTTEGKSILKKEFQPGEYLLDNGFKKPFQTPIKTSSTIVSNLVKEPNTANYDNFNCIGFRPLRKPKSYSNSKISPVEAILYGNKYPKTDINACIETKSLRDVIVSKSSNEEPEIEIILDKSSNSQSNSLSLNPPGCVLNEKTTDQPALDQIVVLSDVEPVETPCNENNESEPALCVISEVVGNFSDIEDPKENEKETSETQVITPKKTNDITKIKGWRRKQFFVEKPTTVEFYSVSKGTLTLKKKIDLSESTQNLELTEEPGNKENAFVCDSLDEFLDREADLKIGYEIPHLFAEFGIKLTSDDIVSRPNLSEEDIKEVGTRYCISVSLPSDSTNLDDIQEEDIRSLKRPIEDDTQTCKILKTDETSSVRSAQKPTDVAETDLEVNTLEDEIITENLGENTHNFSQLDKNLTNIKLLSKLIALVVYPGPFMPLHPIVQYHLDKLRSYRTKVDKRWANFAVSAVLVNDKRYKRSIVPAYCCVKTEKSCAETTNNINTEKIIKPIKIKPCSVVIKKLKSPQYFNMWCMEHNCYNCAFCKLTRPKSVSRCFRIPKSKRPQVPVAANPKEKVKSRSSSEPFTREGETVTVSPRASFNKKIARLLSKKVRLLKANGDTLTSIDCLKTLKRDTIEFIKLKFIKESFLAGYISVWYMKPETSATRSRAFVTFSQTSPAPNAINLRSSALSVNSLPKVITEIVSKENIFDSNEYAILHCNGEIWEIHGSLNITFGNSDKNVEQIFTSLELPELKKLQDIANEILHVKAVKWWVLDLTQKFKLIELKSGDFSTIVTREKFFEAIALNSYGFLTLRKDSENRVLGAYVIQRLLPFVLIGPYYLLETRDMILKGTSSTIPFKYYGEENVTTNYPLKFFINSVIKNLEINGKKLEGLWLYDKMCLDKTSYIEVVTTSLESCSSNKYSSIDIEHGYSLNSLTYSSPTGAASGIVRRKDGKDELQTITVYLYFDIFELGFVEGELQFDNSVIVRHPLDERTKMKSHKIGQWFISIIKRRVQFIPKNLVLKWFLTKHKNDLKERLPFNKFILGGAHVLTKKGVFCLWEMSEESIEELGIDKSEVMRIMSESEVLKEVKELKNLASLLPNQSKKPLKMDEVLTQAVKEIKALKKMGDDSSNEKMLAEKEKLNLFTHFLKLVNSFRVRHYLKIKMIENIQHFFLTKNGELTEEFVRKLKMNRAGWKFIKRLERTPSGNVKKILSKKKGGASENEKFGRIVSTILKCSEINNSLLKKSNTEVLNDVSGDVGSEAERPCVTVQNMESQPVSDQFGSLSAAHPEFSKNSSPKKKSLAESGEKKKIKVSQVVRQTPPNDFDSKNKDFVKLTSQDFRENLRMCWKKWNIKKLEVA